MRKPTTSNEQINSNLNISFLNVCGLKSKLLLPDFDEFLKTCDILGIGETKTCVDDVISFPNYTYFSKPRQHYLRRSGGLGIFVKDSLVPNITIIEIDSEYLMLIKIDRRLISKDEDMYISFVYLPPEGSDYSNSDSFSEIETLLLPYIDSSKYLYIMGDINARTGTCAEHTEFDLDQIATEQYGIDDDVINYLNNGQTLQNQGIKCIRNSQDKIKIITVINYWRSAVIITYISAMAE